PGDTVTAASTTQTIVVAGDGGYEAVTMVKVTDLPDLAVGQAATFVPDGSTRAVTGQVAAIGLVSTAGTTGTTYPVTIAFAGDTSALRNGAAGALTITTAAAASALAVPTSAVQFDDGRYTVTVLDGDETRDVTVEVGAIGATWTEVKEGLTRGQTVVLADLSEPLPGSATSTGGQQQLTPFGGGRGGVGGFQPPRN
ncbi:MAG TPA: hypothetical protein VNA12_08275, partial [Mycobacteriales bacterium]|nr:hypothetical protein [Mycobacteriales bacterium]